MDDLEKYVNYDYHNDNFVYEPWNIMTFYDCQVTNITLQEYDAGKRMSIEITAPRLRKKYFLFAWEDNGICDAIMKSHLKVGDYISCHTELSYYVNKEGRHCEAYRIIANDAFDKNAKENPRNFKLMRIRREKNEKSKSSPFLSKNELIKKMIG